MRRLDLGFPLLGLLLLLPGAARSAPIVLLQDYRVVYADTNWTDADFEAYTVVAGGQAPGDFSDWTGTSPTPVDQGSQTSTATPYLLAGSGSASRSFSLGTSYRPAGYPYYDLGDAFSTFDITFRVTDPTKIDLTGTLSVLSSYPYREAEYQLRRTTGEILYFASINDGDITAPDTLDFEVHTILQPGDYRLIVSADTDPGGSGGSANFDFAFVVPEPGSGPLVALALVTLLAVRRPLRERGRP